MNTLRYLLDTDTIIYIKRFRPPAVRERLDRQARGSVGMSVVTYGELMFGAECGRETERSLEILENLARAIPVINLPRAAANCYGKVRAELARAGQVIGHNDLWIAAHALSDDLTLVTNNEREFRRVPGLKVENWVPGA